ncbi:MAG: exosortase system-associated protein, TIGR04073 family [Candidatus Omnitrophota bacterium]|nr:exosortase system-associated protein, TIGR04073 family [Candidatus Omnitrophota bacterium]
MTKKLFFTAVILSLIVISATPAFCDELSPKFNGPAEKLGRGLCNMLTFPLEVPEQISRVNNSDGPFAASTIGVLKGLGSAIGRACVGVFETATFMFPGPKNYDSVLKDPEYFLESSNF